MLATTWTCRRCLRALARRPLSKLQRQASTIATALPSVLLARARQIASEHERLNTSLAKDYDAKTAKRAGELSSVARALQQWETARASLNELASLLNSDDAEMRELAEEDVEITKVQLDQSSHNLSVALTPKHPFADMPCLIEIVPGPGGFEGRFFAETLFRMYQKYCSNKGYRWRVVKHEVSDDIGQANGEVALQGAILEVQDPGAYSIFRGEAGMHRVQRVPLTEKSGRTHTSAVAVWVMPSFPDKGGGDDEDHDFDDPESDFYVNPVDVRVETMRARGAGGQSVNKTESAIRLTHVPTSTVVSMQDERSQQRNREAAWKVLRARIAQIRRDEREAEAQNLKDSVLARAQVTRGDKIRTYNYGQDRCTDHRCGVDLHNLPDILEGGECLDKLFESVQTWSVNQDIEALITEQETTDSPPVPGKGSKSKR